MNKAYDWQKVDVRTLKLMIDCIQELSDLPFAVSSPSSNILAKAYKFSKKPGIINSVSIEGEKIDKISPSQQKTKTGRSSPCCLIAPAFPKILPTG